MLKQLPLIMLLIPFLAFAGDVNSSRSNIDLARINTILNSTYPLITDAKAHANHNSRVQFHYNSLKSDIQLIQAGIAQKINAQSNMQLPVEDLKSHFTTFAGEGGHGRV